ncbi:MAG: peptide deformylase [Phycisphaerae bacterium]|jgi:peptide deformylase|nr:peptide deformylase [Phycisphaerae bacterium]
MDSSDKIRAADPASLQVVKYPDPRLREICTPVETIDEPLIQLVEGMWRLMLDSRGVGLAAPQVGVTVRLFAASPSFSPDDLQVYINPRIIEASGTIEEEEGCLSFPLIYTKVKRSAVVVVEALDLEGNTFQETCVDLHSRIIQHELDHLDGRLLVDRMGAVSKIANRRALKELEAQFNSA